MIMMTRMFLLAPYCNFCQNSFLLTRKSTVAFWPYSHSHHDMFLSLFQTLLIKCFPLHLGWVRHKRTALMSPKADVFLGLASIPNVLKADGWYRRTWCCSGTEFVSPSHPINSGQLYCSITTALRIRQGLWLKSPAHLFFFFLITPEC